MKKITVLILVLIMCACSKVEQEEQVKEDLLSFEVDMSDYGDALDKDNYVVFKGINLDGVKDALENKKTGIVLISYSDCHNCLDVINDIAKYAKDNNITIYYFNAIGNIDTKEKYNEALALFSPVLDESKEGNKTIFTPETIKIENGEFVDHYIGTDLEKIFKIIK